MHKATEGSTDVTSTHPTPGLSRRRLLALGGLTAGAAGVSAATGPLGAPPASASVTSTGPTGEPPEAPEGPVHGLARLWAGNRRWQSGNLVHPRQTVARRRAVAAPGYEQRPFAVVVSCIDSRVPPEIIFDCGLGDIFVVRTAAATMDDLVLGAIEYGPLTGGTAVVLVLGHDECGAVKKAIEVLSDPHHHPLPGHLSVVVEAIKPAYEAVRRERPLLTAVIDSQTRRTVRRLRRDPALVDLQRAGRLSIVGGRYRLASGQVVRIA